MNTLDTVKRLENTVIALGFKDYLFTVIDRRTNKIVTISAGELANPPTRLFTYVNQGGNDGN